MRVSRKLWIGIRTFFVVDLLNTQIFSKTVQNDMVSLVRKIVRFFIPSVRTLNVTRTLDSRSKHHENLN